MSASPSSSGRSSGTSSGGGELEIPLEPEDISREWLYHVINQYRGSRDLGLIEHPDDITNCSIDECESSNGYLSTTYKLTAFFKCRSQITGLESASYAFFLKMMPGVEKKHRRLIASTLPFQHEVECLFGLLPHMVRETKCALRTPCPEIVYGSYDDTGAGIIVLMDLNDKGFQLQNHYNGYNLRQLSAVVDALAEFHAVGSAIIVESDSGGEEALVERFATLLDPVHSKINAKRRQHTETTVAEYDLHAPFFKDYAKFLRRVPGFLHVYEEMEKAQAAMVRLMVKAKKAAGPSGSQGSHCPRTVLHGELWERNILIRVEQISEAMEVTFCDWKEARVGNPCSDLSFLFISSSAVPLRNPSTLFALADRYYARFTRCLSKVGVDIRETHPGFTLDSFRKELLDSLVGGFLQAVPVMIREERYLEAETYSAEDEGDRERLSTSLITFGRRITDLAEEYVPKVLELHRRTSRAKSPLNPMANANKNKRALQSAATDKNNNKSKGP